MTSLPSETFQFQDSLKQIYNWQFVHCIDFWAIVLARACSFAAEAESGVESELKALIYPLTQVALGAIKYVFLTYSKANRELTSMKDLSLLRGHIPSTFIFYGH